MKVQLFVPCFVDAMHPEAAVAAASVLERLGCEVDCPAGQTCCGQPPFNSGDWEAARAIARRQLRLFAGREPIVALSGSCGAMKRVFYPELFAGTSEESLARAVAARTREFSDFLVNVLKVEDVGASFPARVTFHDGCHGLRELGLKQPPRRLLARVRGLELVEMADAETCCGFGGMFAVKFPMISTAMGEVKCEAIAATGAEVVVSSDVSCLMQISGLLEKQGRPMRCMHLAEVLASRS
ncbi:MAG: (Fe-S)-binding protein [Terrimicrobiaceae bacterium]|nr:(Fe-S)-binding protein [Terrimicrobiaceae bacterium]